jgi:multiple sugar transport system permease protein
VLYSAGHSIPAYIALGAGVKTLSWEYRIMTAPQHTSRRVRSISLRALQYLALLVVAVFFCFPLYWLVLGAFKTNIEQRAQPPIFFTFNPHVALDNLSFALANMPIPGYQVFANSLLIAGGSSIVCIAVGSLAAFAFARFRTGGKNLPFFILSLRIAPPIAIGLPFFIVFRTIGLVDSQIGLMIAYVSMNLPLVVWLLRSFFREMDPSIEEAALIDGASYPQVLRYVTLPLAAPALVATGLLAFMGAWNEFFFAILLTRLQSRTIPSVLPLFTPRELAPTQPIGSGFAVALMSAIPVVILAFALQRYLVRGLSLGGVKG